MPVKCTFDSCAGNCWLLVWKSYSQSWKFVKIRKNFGKKLSNLCSGDAKRSFLKSAGKRTSEVEFFLRYKSENDTKSLLREFCFVSKMTLCTIRMQIWRPCWTLPTIVQHKFQPKYQKLCMNCHILQRGIKFSSNDRLNT